MKATPDAEDLAKMRAMSPIAHVDTVTAPLLFMLGAKDQRRASLRRCCWQLEVPILPTGHSRSIRAFASEEPHDAVDCYALAVRVQYNLQKYDIL